MGGDGAPVDGIQIGDEKEEMESLSRPSAPRRQTVDFWSGGVRLAGHLYLPKEGAAGRSPGVVICHGLDSRKEHHADFAGLLATQGFAVLAFDLRGHGESEGELDEGVAADPVAAAEYLASRQEVDPSRIGIRGSSLGGQLAIHAAAATGLVRAVVSICPAHESLMVGRYRDPELEPRLRQLASSIRLNLDGFARHLQAHDVASAVRCLAPRPLLLVHCRGDEIVPFHLSEKLLAAAGESGELWAIDGGSHTSAQHDRELQLRIAQWLERQLSR